MSKVIKLFMVTILGVSISLSAMGEDVVTAETELLKASFDDKAAVFKFAPAGVFDVEIVDGQIVRLKIKGEGDVPTSMRGSRADRYAREKANRDARASFTKYLGENVVFSESESEGIVIHERDGQENSEIMNTSARLYSSNSAALLNGLIVLMDHLEGEGDKRTCTVVIGWSRKLSYAANAARADMRRTSPEPRTPALPIASPETVNKTTGNTETITRMGNMDDF